MSLPWKNPATTNLLHLSMKDKEQTKQRILDAVGELFKSEGQSGLNIARIAKKAGVDRNLIYRYFGADVKRVMEAYIVQKDYWLKFAERIKSEAEKNNHETSKDLIIDILQKQWQYFSADKEMQHLILWELSGRSELMRSIHNTRELSNESILEMADVHFQDSDIKLRPLIVLLLGGIYYANLHAMYNGNFISGMDVKSEQGQKDILKAIRQILDWAYEHAKIK
jgi:AcrR family transcriptional regulator